MKMYQLCKMEKKWENISKNIDRQHCLIYFLTNTDVRYFGFYQ